MGLVVLQLIGLAFVLRGQHSWAQQKADDWLEGLHGTTPLTTDAADMEFPAARNMDDAVKTRLREQLEEVHARAFNHVKLMKFFHTRYYTTIVMVSITGLITAISGIYVSARGWGEAESWATVVFFTMAAATVYFSAFPKVYKQTENIASNSEAYLSYVNLENELLSYACTGEGKDGQALTPHAFVHYMDVEMEKRNKLCLGFDISKIPDFKTRLVELGAPSTAQQVRPAPGASTGSEAKPGKTAAPQAAPVSRGVESVPSPSM
jgi:hypothetical protein